MALHYFGRQLICNRCTSGTPYVLDSYCPHLGADIAVGGSVGEGAITQFRAWARQSYEEAFA
jgi:hypothetical protein